MLELVGQRVVLRTTTESDRDELVRIRSTREVHRRWRGDDLVAEFDADLGDPDAEQLTIHVEERIVGLIQFHEEQEPDYRHASLDLYVDPALHRCGHATDAIVTVVEHLVSTRGHHRLTIDPAAENIAAIRCYAAVGFVPVGTLRQYERQADGTWADGLLMELLAAEWKGGSFSRAGRRGPIRLPADRGAARPRADSGS
ncbi:MAG: GNAT family protein [Ilumatobacteraceae bacterium]